MYDHENNQDVRRIGNRETRGAERYKYNVERYNTVKLVSQQKISPPTKKSADFSRQKNRPIFSPIFFQVVGEFCR